MTVAVRLTIDTQALEKAFGPKRLDMPLKRFLGKAALTVERKAKEKAPVDTGRLRSSITRRVETSRAVVGSGVTYAPFVEFGTRPHMPPVQALARWARRHGFASPWPLAMAIKARGTKAHPFLRPALEDSKGDISGFLREMAQEVEKGG